MRELLPDEIADRIMEKIAPLNSPELRDKPFWQLESKGHFSVKTVWQYIRKNKQKSSLYKFIWAKGLPFKISFFMWRLWKAKLPLDDYIRRTGYFQTSKCWCCTNSSEETLAHIFLTSPTTMFVWKYFCGPIGINIDVNI